MKFKFLAVTLFAISFSQANAASIPVNFSQLDNTIPLYNGLSGLFLSSGCFKASCYEDAADFAYDNHHIQPLTNEASIVQLALDQQNGMNSTPYSYSLYSYLPWYTPDTYLPNEYSTYSGSYSIDYVWRNIQGGGYSSSMQGLLWAWRTISNKWVGIWNSPSYYESYLYSGYCNNSPMERSVLSRQSLLPSANKKHILIISDALDNDGPPGKTVASTATEYFTILDFNNPKLNFSVCDAHKPIQSISKEDYENTCNAIAAQGIKVHVLFVGSTDNNRLQSCATITKGKYVKLATSTPADVTKALSEIQANMAPPSTSNVRLIPVPDGY